MTAGSEAHVVMLGVDPPAREAARRLRARGGRVIGFLAPHGSAVGDDVVGVFGDLGDILRREVVDRVVAVPPAKGRREAIKRALRTAEPFGIPVFTEQSMARFLGRQGSEDLSDVHGLVCISSTPRVRGFSLKVKAIFDRVLALLMIFMGLPMLPIIALAIKFDSRGPVVFRQVRVRENGRHFQLYKFRTMVANAEDLKARLTEQNQVDGPAFKIEGDPRITRTGEMLRHFRLDELPQLFNILRGEMSFVGPRPPLPDEVSRYEDWYCGRLAMKPGLTCLWQLDGPLEVGFKDWMRLDLEYIENWSLALDLKIFLKTIPLVLLGTRAM